MRSKSEDLSRLLAFLALVVLTSSLTIISSSVAIGTAVALFAIA